MTLSYRERSATGFRSVAAGALDLLPRVCLLCEELLGAQADMVCIRCWTKLQPLPHPRCAAVIGPAQIRANGASSSTRVAVLGAGGGAAGVLAAVERWPGATAVVSSRSHERAKALVARFSRIATLAHTYEIAVRNAD